LGSSSLRHAQPTAVILFIIFDLQTPITLLVTVPVECFLYFVRTGWCSTRLFLVSPFIAVGYARLSRQSCPAQGKGKSSKSYPFKMEMIQIKDADVSVLIRVKEVLSWRL